MSTFDRQMLSTHDFTTGLRALADMLDTDAFDGVQVLDEREHPAMGESILFLVNSEEAVRTFAARHQGSEIEEHRDDDTGNMLRVTASLGFGRGVDHGESYGPIPSFAYAVVLEVTYRFPKAAS